MKPKYKRFCLRMLMWLLSILSLNCYSYQLWRPYIKILKEKIYKSKVDELNKKLEEKNSNLRVLDKF
jgi:hypothetical protein